MITVKCARCAAPVDEDENWGLVDDGRVLCNQCSFAQMARLVSKPHRANAILAEDRRQWKALAYGMMAAALGALLAIVTLVCE